jgi:hypothetical protein
MSEPFEAVLQIPGMFILGSSSWAIPELILRSKTATGRKAGRHVHANR